jgi:WD40 repeat protein
METLKKYHYDAFISYRHTELDKMVAKKLHKMLETYKVPSTIARKTGKKKINRVFRDRDELPTSTNLAASIQEALENSEYLIVICSRETQKSQWVLKEIETFIKLHGQGKVLALLIDGEPYESFPKQLRFVHKQVINKYGNIEEKVIEVEPLAADIRAETKSQTIKILKTELLRLAAPILGCNYDDLKQRHRERFIKKVVTLSACISLFFIVFGTFSTWQAFRINQEHKNTLKSQSMYLSNISSNLLNEGDRKTAMLLALDALPKNVNYPDRPYVEDAEFSLSRAMAAYKSNNHFIGDMSLNHKKPVSNLQISNDGKKIITSCRDGYIYIWKTSDGKLISKFKQGCILASKSNQFFSKDGKNVIFLSEDGLTAKNIYSKKNIWNVKCDNITQIAMSNDGKKIAYIMNYINDCTNYKLIIRDSATGKQLSSISLGNKNDYYGIAFSNDTSKIAAVTDKNYISVINIHTSKEIYKLKLSYPYTSEVIFSPDDKMIVAASNYEDPKHPISNGKGILSIWNSADGKALYKLNINTSTIHNLTFTHDNSNILAFSEGSKVSVLNINFKNIFYSISHSGNVNSIVMLNGGLMCTSDSDGAVKFSTLGNGVESEEWQINQPNGISAMDIKNGIIAVGSSNSNAAYVYKTFNDPKIKYLAKYSSAINDGCFSKDGKFVLSYCDNENALHITNVKKAKNIGTIKQFSRPIGNAIFTDNDKYISVLCEDGYLSLWNYSNFKFIKKLNLNYSQSYNFRYKYSNDGSLIAAIQNKKINVFDTVKCKKILSVKTKNIADTIAFSSDNQKLCFSSGKNIYIVDKHNPNNVKLIKKLNQDVLSVNFSYDNNSIIVGLDDKSINFYNLKSTKLERTLSPVPSFSGFTSNLKKCFYSKDGSLLITIGEGNEADIWSTSDYKLLASLDCFIDMDKNEKNILASSYQNLMLIPRYDTDMLITEAKKQLKGRTLTHSEKEEYFISN